MLVLLIVLVCVAGVSAVPTHPQRIGGGSNTTINQYPSVVALLYSANMISYWHTCAGTILNDYSILTAAHCIDGDATNKWQIRAGSTYANSGGVVHNIGTVIIHPDYNKRILDDDVAILRSVTTIVFNNVTKPGFIAGSNYELSDNEVVRAVGWGTTSFGGPTSVTLRLVQLWVVNQAVCRIRYTIPGVRITDNMLCSGWLDVSGHDQCQGDSGGPLYHNNIQVGVYAFSRFCDFTFYPRVNARVSSYTTWIQSNA